MLDAAIAAAGQIFTPPFRKVLWKTLALTLALLALAWVGLEKLVIAALALPIAAPYPWVTAVLSFIGGIGLFVGLAFLVTPVSFLVAGFFFDELAEHVEIELDPAGAGQAMPLGDAAWVAVQFAALALLVNLIALALLFVPGRQRGRLFRGQRLSVRPRLFRACGPAPSAAARSRASARGE